jgi:hypothetical protein
MKLFLLAILLMGAGVAAHANPVEPNMSVSPAGQPFIYQLGRTTKQQAFDYWKDQGATLLGSGHLALGAGSGRDNSSQVVAPEVELIDVQGVDFEGLPVARFAFYKDTLYAIQAQVRSVTNKENVRLRLSDDEVRELGRRLEQKYGKPTRRIKTLLADGREPDVRVWTIKGNTLRFQDAPLNAVLVYANPAMEAEVKKHIAATCKVINAKKDAFGCW